MAERTYQARLVVRIRHMFPGCLVLKNDSGYRQGIPDLLILFNERWAALEVKDHEKARERPNQRYYVEQLNEMSFAAFIYPENEGEVLRDLQFALEPSRSTRVSQR